MGGGVDQTDSGANCNVLRIYCVYMQSVHAMNYLPGVGIDSVNHGPVSGHGHCVAFFSPGQASPGRTISAMHYVLHLTVTGTARHGMAWVWAQ